MYFRSSGFCYVTMMSVQSKLLAAPAITCRDQDSSFMYRAFSLRDQNYVFSRSCHLGAQVVMVIYCVIGCLKRSDRDKDVSFCRIPSVTDCYREHNHELRKKRQASYLAVISRQDMDMPTFVYM